MLEGVVNIVKTTWTYPLVVSELDNSHLEGNLNYIKTNKLIVNNNYISFFIINNFISWKVYVGNTFGHIRIQIC